MKDKFKVDNGRIKKFCDKWDIVEFSLFGSVLRDDFGPESDVDVLIKFGQNSKWTLIDFVEMKTELESLIGRSVDLVTKQSVEMSRNGGRKAEILNSAKVVYAKAG